MGALNTATPQNKIEQTPNHRKKYYQHSNTARFTWSKCLLFFKKKKNVITVTSTFQTQETHYKTFLPHSPHVKFLVVAYTSFIKKVKQLVIVVTDTSS